MTITLDRPVRQPTPHPVAPPPTAPGTTRIALYGDLTCPWSYLASRRAALLEADGVAVDWWMVEHDRPTPGRRVDPGTRLEATRRDLDRVSRRLLPGEHLPHALAGFVPYTKPAVSGYAEAFLAGVGSTVRRLLFDAFWMHAVDLGDARLVRTLLVDAVRSGNPASELLRDWGYAVDVTGAPVTADAWRLVGRWREGWSRGGEIVPVLVLDGGRRLDGAAAVEWLGAELVRRDVDLDQPPPTYAAGTDATPGRPQDLVDLSWATQHGNRWMQARRNAHAPDLFSRLRPWI
jgi:hypothetical protein